MSPVPPAGAAGAAGTTPGGCANGCAACNGEVATWTCPAAVRTGPCCDANGAREPQCRSSCPLEDDPHGLPCDTPGQTRVAPVVSAISQHCEDPLFACYVHTCTCGCRAGAIAIVPGLSETCEPVLFANASHFPQTIAIYDGFVYWTAAGYCPLSGDDVAGTGKVMGARQADGSGAVAILDQPCPYGIAAIDDDLYWTNKPGIPAGSVWTARSNGQNARPFVEGLNHPSTIRVDSVHVYWFDGDGIYRSRRDGGGPPELFAAIEYLDSQIVSTFVLDERYVYWIDGGPLGDGRVLRAAKSGGDLEILAAIGQPFEIAISSEGLFWIEDRNFQELALFMLRWDDETPALLAALSERPRALDAFRTEAYWVQGESFSPGFVYGISAGDSAPFVVATDQPAPLAIAVDTQYVFWANMDYLEAVGHNGQIVRACR
jgi:hypothetical protein